MASEAPEIPVSMEDCASSGNKCDVITHIEYDEALSLEDLSLGRVEATKDGQVYFILYNIDKLKEIGHPIGIAKDYLKDNYIILYNKMLEKAKKDQSSDYSAEGISWGDKVKIFIFGRGK